MIDNCWQFKVICSNLFNDIKYNNSKYICTYSNTIQQFKSLADFETMCKKYLAFTFSTFKPDAQLSKSRQSLNIYM